MKTAIFVFFFEFVFSITCVIFFGCLFGSCTNNLVCFIHYIKFVHSIYMMYTYYNNIHEKQPNHPMSTINTFIVILIYNCCLYVYIGFWSINFCHFVPICCHYFFILDDIFEYCVEIGLVSLHLRKRSRGGFLTLT